MGEKKKQRLAEAARALALTPGTPAEEAAEIPATPSADGATPEPEPAPAPAHPEEMKASVTLRVGDRVSLTATARATPAGLVAAALITTAVMVPLIWISSHRRART